MSCATRLRCWWQFFGVYDGIIKKKRKEERREERRKEKERERRERGRRVSREPKLSKEPPKMTCTVT
jgi:hypothetical protein